MTCPNCEKSEARVKKLEGQVDCWGVEQRAKADKQMKELREKIKAWKQKTKDAINILHARRMARSDLKIIIYSLYEEMTAVKE